MARLTRVRQKVFASNASNNGVFGSLQAGNPTTSNDVATLQSLSAFENGWDYAIEQGDKLPPLEEFQGIQYGISYQQAYMLQEGIAEWDANTPYYKGGLVKTISGTSFRLYCSIADNNTGKVVTNTSYWKKVMDSDDLYAFDNMVVHLSGAETINDVKTVTGHWNFKTEQTISNESVTKGTNPKNTQYTTLSFCDKNGTAFSPNQLGNVQHRLDNDGTSVTSLNAVKNEANSISTASIGVVYRDDGTKYGYAPTPPLATDNSTKIATTAWVKNAVNNGTLGIPKYNARTTFTTETEYSPPGNGIIVVKAHADSPYAQISVSDGFVISRAKVSGDASAVVVWAIVRKGGTYNTNGKGTVTRWFIPFG